MLDYDQKDRFLKFPRAFLQEKTRIKVRSLHEPVIDFWASRFIYLALLTVWLSIPLASVKNAQTPPPWDPVQPIQIAVAF